VQIAPAPEVKGNQQMINGIDATEFSRAWAAAWNRRDLEAVLHHFHDEAVFTSPVAQRIGFAVDGIVTGKDALRRYWTAALARNPQLHFDVTAVYQGIDTLVIVFKTQDGANRAEGLTFRDGLVIEGHGTFEKG
jgi:ketosteroid isomerase-like protein